MADPDSKREQGDTCEGVNIEQAHLATMKKAVVILGLVIMAVGFILTAFGTQILPAAQALFAPSNSCPSPCYPVSAPVYYMMPQGQTAQPNFSLNYIGAGLAILGAIVFGVAYPTKRLNSVRLYSISPVS